MSRRITVQRIAGIATVPVIQLLWLRLMGRSYFCPCGEIHLWQGQLDPARNAQQFADWYSLLHVIFGMGVYTLLTLMRPGWRLYERAMMALLSSAIWEIMENAPWIIEVINRSSQGPHYSGDSILNSLEDTLFAMIGFLLGWRLPKWSLLPLAAALEISVSLAIHDGLILGTLRLMGGNVD
ncbi:DUF2585 family protein [Kushneria phosphatilytica]|uniref:DUF2585 family protein n=1 Tax=Kushneria phosphatilytica TaxID=657387 RepID=A0A1S1NY86_9GAMM|nr:DUF2585 family protein [Kushneria phosphatilytica]OHV13835.1 hypothetical protein BH688_00285 [Kushneria phosphatilytica]QEL10389.1 DUF2585 family protein [Kushneria phosphatilytica]